MGAFQSFTKSYGKTYTSGAEYQERLQSFNQNVKYIAAHNSLDATYKVSVVPAEWACPSPYNGALLNC